MKYTFESFVRWWCCSTFSRGFFVGTYLTLACLHLGYGLYEDSWIPEWVWPVIIGVSVTVLILNYLEVGKIIEESDEDS